MKFKTTRKEIVSNYSNIRAVGSSFFGNWEDDGIEEDLKTFLKRMEKFTK